MAIETLCAGCRLPLRVSDENRGKQARCPACGYLYRVPGTPEISMGEVRHHQATTSNYPATSASQFPATPAPVGASYTSAPLPRPANNGNPPLRPTGAGGGWYMKTPEGQTYGPVERPELDKWLGEGRIAADCDLREGLGSWMPAERVYPLLAPRPVRAPAGYRAPGLPLAAHRAGLILGLAIAGLATAVFFGCPVFSIMAWVMGGSDLREMDAGRMDPSGRDTTRVGQLTGMIVSLIWIFVSVAALFFFLIAAASNM